MSNQKHRACSPFHGIPLSSRKSSLPHPPRPFPPQSPQRLPSLLHGTILSVDEIVRDRCATVILVVKLPCIGSGSSARRHDSSCMDARCRLACAMDVTTSHDSVHPSERNGFPFRSSSMEKNERRASLLDLQRHFKEGLNCMEEGRYREALDHWDEILRLDPNGASSYPQRAKVLRKVARTKLNWTTGTGRSTTGRKGIEKSRSFSKRSEKSEKSENLSGKKRLLLVEDSVEMRRSLCRMLVSAGYEVVEADNGAQALSKIESDPPDLIVTDIQMPEMDGWELAWRLKRSQRTAKIPFIFLTCRGEADDRIRGLESGADDYIAKPFQFEELEIRIQNILKRTGSQGNLPAHATPPEISDLPAGTLIANRYEVEAKLGEGGMAVVYRVRDLELFEETLAIKILHLDTRRAQRMEEAVNRFKREIMLARQILHPNVIRIFDYGNFENHPFISMEYIEGESLRDLLAREGTLPLQEALRMTKAICDALGAVHDIGVIHRDVKPQNILISKGGVLKLVDFGISKLIDSATLDITKGRVGLGTPNYMAPEQVLHRPIDARTDIYALGVTLFKMITGRYPFEEQELFLKGTLMAPPLPPSFYNPAFEADVDRLVLQALEQQKERRYPNVSAFKEAIETLERKLDGRWPPRTVPSRPAAAIHGPDPTQGIELPPKGEERHPLSRFMGRFLNPLRKH
ncbi:MAG: response regulator [Deltaproteobacteria bacterium]|nr:MAG: response regulator [Deltaproteobacteria bacterium]